MKRNEEETLLRFADAVNDGEAIDWESEQTPSPEVASKLRHLRVIDQIAATHRELHSAAFPAPAPSEAETVNSPVDPALLAIRTWGPLRIIAEIGRGGFGAVYRAHDPTLMRDVALKLIRGDRLQDEQAVRRFLREARRLAQVKHPNVLVVHGADEHEARAGLWTDLLEGRTLEELLNERGPFGPEEAALIGIDVCRALAAVHAAGLVHRDVKTANIMRERGGRIVLMDFGAVREMKGQGESSGELSGTPLFMAPELLEGTDSGVRTDFYSLGVVLYRLVTGRYPVESDRMSELREKHRRRAAVPLRDMRSDLPAAFVKVVERATSPEPENRYASIGEMERALNASLGAPDAPVAARPRWGRWSAALASLAAVAVLAVLLLSRPPASTSLDAEVGLFRRTGTTEERLLPGAAVHVGDRLFLEISGSSEMYLYLVDQDEAGRTYVLFPLPGLALQNPLAMGTRHRLPGKRDGGVVDWEVSVAGGRETVTAIMSRNPLTGLEKTLADLPRAGEDLAVEIDPEDLAQALRGIGGLSPALPPPGGGQTPLSGILEALALQSAQESGLRIWKIDLNQAP